MKRYIVPEIDIKPLVQNIIMANIDDVESGVDEDIDMGEDE